VLNDALGPITTPRAPLEGTPTLAEEMRRFRSLLEARSARWVQDFELPTVLAERLLQGPL